MSNYHFQNRVDSISKEEEVEVYCVHEGHYVVGPLVCWVEKPYSESPKFCFGNHGQQFNNGAAYQFTLAELELLTSEFKKYVNKRNKTKTLI